MHEAELVDDVIGRKALLIDGYVYVQCFLVSISSMFYVRIFRTNVVLAAFSTYM